MAKKIDIEDIYSDTCPFCGTEIVEEDQTEIDGDYETICTINNCKHVAFWGVCGLEPFCFVKGWKTRMVSIGNAFKKKGFIDEYWNDDGAEAIAYFLHMRSRDVSDESDDYVLEIMRTAVKDADVNLRNVSWSTGDGPHGHGVATYIAILMNKRKK